MHFIQNNWFANNWLLLLLFLVGTLMVVAYIQNRPVLLKRTAFLFLFLGMCFIFFFFLPQLNHSLSLQNSLLPDLSANKSSEENISAFSKFIDFVVDILKDRLND